MTSTALVRPVSAVTWELRRAWATGRRVSVTLERCDMNRLEGIVVHVSGTGAVARIRGLLVPTERILAVHWPTVLGDGERLAGGPLPDGKARLPDHPNQEELAIG